MNSGNSSQSKNVFSIISAIIAIIELIVLIIGSIIFPIYFNNSTEQEIVKILGHYLEDINEDATFAEMLQTISTKLNSLEQENANLVADNEQLKNRIKTYEDKESIDKRNSTIIEEATAYATSGNYEQAITVLKNVTDRTSAMDNLLVECSEKYQTQVLQEAETLMEGKKYDDALLVVDKAIKLLPSNVLLTDEYQSIMARYPKKFSELTLSEKKRYSIASERQTDTVGNSYYNNVGTIYAEGKEGYGAATYYLGGSYRYLSLTIAVSNESEDRTDTDLNGRIEIYTKNGDEYIPIFESPSLTRAFKPIDIEDLDIGNCEFIEIRYYNNGEYWNLAQGNHSLRVLIANGSVYN